MRRALAESLAFNLGGAYLHDLYWRSLAPQGAGGAPSPQLTAQIQRDFGSIGMLAQELTDVGLAMQGSGWAMLAYSPYLGRLVVLSVGDHDNRIPPGVAPLLPIDVWEHAYYLDRGPDRGAYLRQFWGIIDWTALSRRFAAVMGQRPGARSISPSSRPQAAQKPAPSQAPQPRVEPEEALGDDEEILASERRHMREQGARIRAAKRRAHRQGMQRRAARSREER
jgi:hypothetical protein